MEKRKKRDKTISSPRSDDRWLAVFNRANTGDETALAEVRKLLRSRPDMISALCGDLAEQAEKALLDQLTGKQPIFCEVIAAKLDAMRTELAGPKPSSIERLLVERVVACWLQVYHADAIAAQYEDRTFAHGDYNHADRIGHTSDSCRPSERWRPSAGWPCQRSLLST